MTRINTNLLQKVSLCRQFPSLWIFKTCFACIFHTFATPRQLAQYVIAMCFVVFPTQAAVYTFSDGSSTLPAGCNIVSTGNYSCGVLTLAVGDTIIIGDTKPATITFTGAFTTAKDNLINSAGVASDLSIIMIGVLTLGVDSVLNANVNATAAVNLGIGSTLSGYIDTVSATSTANVTGIVTLGANSSVGSYIRTDAGAVTVGSSSSVDGSISTTAGVVTILLNVSVAGPISTTLGAVNIEGSSTISGGITTEAGVVTLTTDVKVGGDIRTVAGGITIGDRSSTCGSVISTGAGVVTLTNDVEVGGDISTVAGAITVGNGSTVGGNIIPSGAGVVTLTGVLVGGKVITGAGAINMTNTQVGGKVETGAGVIALTGSRVRGTVISTSNAAVTLTNSVDEDTSLIITIPTARGCPTTSEFSHIQIEHDGVGSTCAVESFTIKACADATCSTLVDSGNITAVLTPFGTAISIDASGQVTLPVSSLEAGVKILSATSISPAPTTLTTTCLNTTTNIASCSLLVSACADGGFACLENGVNSSWDANARKPLYTKLVNTDFRIDIAALKSDGTLETSYVAVGAVAKTVKFELVEGSATNVCADLTAISSTVLENQSFSDTDLGRITTNMKVTKAYSNLRCRVTDVTQTPNVTTCSTDSFAVRPLRFVVSSSNANADDNGANTTASTKIKAGTSFNLIADTSTIGYNGTPLIGTNAVEAHSGANTNGVLTGGFNPADATNGKAISGSFTYNDVGYFRLSANTLTDKVFTTVDQSNNDCTDDFSNSLSDGKYGCKIGNIVDTNYFGRFYPDHFDVAVVPGCNVNDFTYSAQPFKVIVTAKNGLVPSTTTSNYNDSDTPSFAQQVVLSDANNITQGVLSPVNMTANAFSMGVANPTPAFTFNNAATAPMIIALRAIDSDDVSSSGYESAATNTIRSGRVRLLNAYGSEILDLPMTMRAEYWLNAINGWQINTDDTCTDVTLSFATMSAVDITEKTCVQDTGANDNSGEACTDAAPAARQYKKVGLNDFQGNFNLWLKAPGTIGSISVTAEVPSWLKYSWTGTAATNPKGLASFGISKLGSNKMVYRQELY